MKASMLFRLLSKSEKEKIKNLILREQKFYISWQMQLRLGGNGNTIVSRINIH